MNFTFTAFDWILSGLILIFAFSGLAKGFANNVLGKLAFILGVVFACLFYAKIAVVFFKGTESVALKNALSFLLIFIAVFLIVKIVQGIISKIFAWQPLKSLDRTLGFFFGIIEGLAVVWLILFLLSIQPFFSAENLIRGSFYQNLINNFMEKSGAVISVEEAISNV